MDNSFLAYLQQLELMAFFSGYPLIYTIIFYFFGHKASRKNDFSYKVIPLLPRSYALSGTLYLGYQLKKLYPGYPLDNIQQEIHYPFLTAWALLSLLFWIPIFNKKTMLSLLHSLVFFLFLIRDLFLQLSTSPADDRTVRNDMKIYTASIVVHLATLACILFFSFLYTQYKRLLRP